MNKLTPKVDFIRDSKIADNHQETVLNPDFRAACGVALLQYTINLSTVNLQSAAENAYKIQGAKEVIEVLLNLGDHSQQSSGPSPDNLDPV